VLFFGAVVLFIKRKTACSLIQLLGAGGLMVVVLTHVSETFHLLPWMHWGAPDGIGHYIDFWSAIFGLTLFPAGYLCHALAKRGGRRKVG
jgi:formate hydrogenlyase subunit 3/multisubunit Na+/H+ antiporter MnhD subunit